MSELLNLEEVNERFKKSICGHFNIFDFCFSDSLHLPSLSQCFLVLHQQFTHSWTCSLWKVLIHLFWWTREHLNCRWLTSQYYFNWINLAKKPFPSLYFKVEHKGMIHRQAFLASNRDDYLMIAVHSFQFWNKTWSNFSEWCLLMYQSCPQHEVQRIF